MLRRTTTFAAIVTFEGTGVKETKEMVRVALPRALHTVIVATKKETEGTFRRTKEKKMIEYVTTKQKNLDVFQSKSIMSIFCCSNLAFG